MPGRERTCTYRHRPEKPLRSMLLGGGRYGFLRDLGGLALGSGGATGVGRVPVFLSSIWRTLGPITSAAPVLGLTRTASACMGDPGWPGPTCCTTWTRRPSCPLA